MKDATDEQKETKETALGRLVERTVRSKVDFSGSIRALREKTNTEYDKLLGQNQSVLDGLSSSLQVRLAKWAHPQAELAVKWDKDQEKAVRVEEPFARIMAGECGFVGELGRFGHGFRRSFLLAILEELAGNDAAGAPRLLLGIEEPELFQHPPQAQYLGEVLQRLTEGNAQVFACTHSPHFVVGKGFEDVLLVRKPAGSTSAVVSRTTFQAVANHLTAALGEPLFTRAAGLRAKINQSLQPALREMFFAPTLVLVEGLEDVAYLTAGLHLLGLWEKWRATGAHIVPVNKKSELIRPLAIAQVLKIPTLVIFDADGDETRSSARVTHAKDNERLLRLLEKPTHELFPSTTTWERHFVVWPTNFGATVQADFPEEDWRSWKSEVEAELGQPGGLEKNSLFIAAVLSKAWETGKPSATLERTCKHVLQFAETSLK